MRDAMIDTNVNNSAELDGIHEDRRGAIASGKLASHSHGTTGSFPSPNTTTGGSPAYSWELVFPGRA
jgi:hypothetical protein